MCYYLGYKSQTNAHLSTPRIAASAMRLQDFGEIEATNYVVPKNCTPEGFNLIHRVVIKHADEVRADIQRAHALVLRIQKNVRLVQEGRNKLRRYLPFVKHQTNVDARKKKSAEQIAKVKRSARMDDYSF